MDIVVAEAGNDRAIGCNAHVPCGSRWGARSGQDLADCAAVLAIRVAVWSFGMLSFPLQLLVCASLVCGSWSRGGIEART